MEPEGIRKGSTTKLRKIKITKRIGKSPAEYSSHFGCRAVPPDERWRAGAHTQRSSTQRMPDTAVIRAIGSV